MSQVYALNQIEMLRPASGYTKAQNAIQRLAMPKIAIADAMHFKEIPQEACARA
tara:strand:+ start:5918 stop:6079 length:162 start_codon:yes stop_codon:yes gene_type:complete